MKAFLSVILVAYLGVATVGLAGGGPDWLRYVGAGTVILLLLLILQGVSNIPSTSEQKKMFVEAQRTVDDFDVPEERAPSTTAPRRATRN